jgi:hypothetical protein
MKLENQTPFLLDRMIVLDPDGAETLVIIAKATFVIENGGALALRSPQLPLQLIDEFYGEPGLSSIRLASEATPPKPGTDILLSGFARARAAGTRTMDVSLRVGPVSKTVRALGPRKARRLLWWSWITKPGTFAKIPLKWEHAYGGTDETPAQGAWESRNPVGRGFRARRSKIPLGQLPLPHLEDPRQLLRRPGMSAAPACFAPIARHWAPRVGYAGTYDDAWKKERIPLLPRDFDPRFYHCAPPDLVASKPLRGDEKVELSGCVREERLKFRLPGLRFAAQVRLRTRRENVELQLDTVAIDAEARELVLVHKGAVRVHGEVPEILSIDLQLAPDSATSFRAALVDSASEPQGVAHG